MDDLAVIGNTGGPALPALIAGAGQPASPRHDLHLAPGGDMAKPIKVVFVACPVCSDRVEGKELGQHILSGHADVAWRLYAQIYLEKMWFGQCELDKRLVDKFKNGVTCEMLRDLFSPKKYNVARTVPGRGPAKYTRFTDVLNSYRDIEMTKKNVPSIIEREEVNLRNSRGRPKSAITKSLWMMKQHPIVIYDGNTWKGLQRRGLEPGNSYSTYFNAWFKFFDDPETEQGLKDALKWLPESPAAQRIVEKARADAAKQGQAIAEEKGRAVADEIRTLAASDLMRNRVTDMRLFHEGGGFFEDSLASCNLAG
jgi:hypothetical protein